MACCTGAKWPFKTTQWDIFSSYGKFTRQHMHGFMQLLYNLVIPATKNRANLPNYYPIVVFMLVSICSKWFSRQQISLWHSYMHVWLIGFAVRNSRLPLPVRAFYYNYIVLVLLQVLQYTTSWTTRPTHHSLYSVPLPTSSLQCPPSVSRSSSHCYHINRGVKVTSKDVAKSEVGGRSLRSWSVISVCGLGL